MMVMMGEVPGVVGGPGQGADLYRIWEGFQEEQHLSWILKYKHELTSWKGAGRCSRLTEGQMQERYGFWRGFALVQLTVAASNKMGGGKQGQIMEGF